MNDRDKFRSSQNRSFEERIAELEKADEEGRLTDAMIAQTLIIQLRSDDQFRILQPWVDKITTSEGREQAWGHFWFMRAKLAVKEKRYSDAEAFAAKVPELDHRAILMFDIAEKQLADVNESAIAYQTLADVSKLASSSEDSLGKARVQLGLANLYEKFNHGFAISELSESVRVANKMKDEDLLSSSIRRRIQVKGFSFFSSYGVPNYGLEETFKNLSKDDFSLPLSNAKMLEDKYYRTLAVIAIAKNCIDIPRKRPER